MFEAHEKRLVTIYKAAEKEIEAEIQKSLLRGLKSDSYTVTRLKESRDQIAGILKQLQRESSKWVKESTPAAYAQGVLAARDDLLKAGARIVPKLGKLHEGAAQILADSVFSRLADVLTTAGRKVDDIYAKIRLDASLRGGALGYEAWTKTRKTMLDNLAANGITGFVDRAGKRWSLSTYTEMLARTSLMDIHNEAKGREFLDHGEDLVIISSHPGTCEKCAPWEHKVLSLSGHTKGYPTLGEAETAGLFHPRCRHAFSLFMEGIDKAP